MAVRKNSTKKHTPGPWIAENYDLELKIASAPRGAERVAIGVFGQAFQVASVGLYVGRGPQSQPGLTFRQEEADANARLIAAAPELLAALAECITDDGSQAMTDESRNSASIARRRLDAISAIARAAIAKAKGGAA